MPIDLCQQLRSAIEATHQHIEATPFARAMIAGSITRADYLTALDQLTWLHAGFEAMLEWHLELRCVYRPELMNRTASLLRDRSVLGATEELAEMLPETRRLFDRLESWSVRRDGSPWSLLGALYVLEGSRMGSMVLWRPLATALGVRGEPGQGLDYHLDGLAERPRVWKAVKESFGRIPDVEGRGTELTAAAAATMAGLYDLYAVLPAPAGAAAVADPHAGTPSRFTTASFVPVGTPH